MSKTRAEHNESERRAFISGCIAFDTPRLASEVYPDSVRVEADVNYGTHELDVYWPENGRKDSSDAFFLIHGGAFVYGMKELDKRFGMHLAIESGIPVVNVNYTLLPEADLQKLLGELFEAANFIADKYGFTNLHYIGDSAGGYLALIMSCLTRSSSHREELGLPLEVKVQSASVNPVCGCYVNDKEGFPACYFKSAEGKELPDYIYNLFDLVKMTGSPRIAIVTGDQDFLREDNCNLKALCDELGIQAEFIDAVSNDEETAFHVFPIAEPTKPQGYEAVRMFARNAIG